MCGFMLRESPHFRRFGARFPDIAPVRRLVVPNFGPSLENLSCGITITQLLLGDGCEWVQSSGDKPLNLVRLHYEGPDGGTDAIVANASGFKVGKRGMFGPECKNVNEAVDLFPLPKTPGIACA